MAAARGSMGGTAGAPSHAPPGSSVLSPPQAPSLLVRPLYLYHLAQAAHRICQEYDGLAQVRSGLATQMGQPQATQAARATSQSLGKIIAHPNPWDSKGDSAMARHFLAAFFNWAYA